jgi:hypothetical protein
MRCEPSRLGRSPNRSGGVVPLHQEALPLPSAADISDYCIERILRSHEVAAWVGWPGRMRPTAPETAKGMLSERPKAREAGDYDVTYE